MRAKSRRATGVRRRGFTLIEACAATTIAAAGACSLCVMGGADDPPARAAPAEGAEPSQMERLIAARAKARQLKDATQVRGVMQAMVIWATNNKNVYPLPELVDAQSGTFALEAGESAASKNTTANIFSILVFNGMISPEICVSPAEASRKIKVDDDYEYVDPKTAAKPSEALWDPAFSADFSRRRPGGNVSYAHLQPSKNRKAMWGDTFSTTEAVVGNRAPRVTGIERDDQNTYTAKVAGKGSVTYKIHGDETSWEGNIAFNDGHVEFFTSLAPQSPPPAKPGEIASPWAAYAATVPTQPDQTQPKLDCFYYDEKDDAGKGKNIYLGVWLRAGENAEQFKGIWD